MIDAIWFHQFLPVRYIIVTFVEKYRVFIRCHSVFRFLSDERLALLASVSIKFGKYVLTGYFEIHANTRVKKQIKKFSLFSRCTQTHIILCYVVSTNATILYRIGKN